MMGYRALLRPGRGQYRRELRDCLEASEDFRESQTAADRETWKRMGTSRTVTDALVKREGRGAIPRPIGKGPALQSGHAGGKRGTGFQPPNQGPLATVFV